MREKSLTLVKAIHIVRSNEITSKQLEYLKSTTNDPPKEEVNLVRNGKGKNFKTQLSGNPKQGKKVFTKKKTTGNARCKFSGKQELHSKRNDCPAYNQKCGFCQKWHHFASVYMAKKRNEVHLLEENCESSEEPILKVEEISTVESNGNRWFATFSFQNVEHRQETQLKCQLDTSATCNVLSYRDLLKYQMPTLEELLPKYYKAKVFSTLGAKDSFYQISVDDARRRLTTFWTPFGCYRYLRMPFGVSLAPEEFESNLQEKLADLEGVEVIRDDILVMGFGETHEQAVRNHDENLVKLLERARICFKDSMPVVSAFNIFNPTAIPNHGTAEFTSYGCKEMATLTKQYFPNNEESQCQANAEWEKLKYDLVLWKGQIPEELENVTPTEWSLRRLCADWTHNGLNKGGLHLNREGNNSLYGNFVNFLRNN